MVFGNVFAATRTVVLVQHRAIPEVMLLRNKTRSFRSSELQQVEITLIRFLFQAIVICILDHLTIHILRNLLGTISDATLVVNIFVCEWFSKFSDVNICCVMKALLFGVFAFVAQLSIRWKGSWCWRMLLYLLVLLALLRRHRQLIINSLRWFVVALVGFVWGPLLLVVPFNSSESILLIFLNIRLFWHGVIWRSLRRPIIYIIFHPQVCLLVIDALWDTFVRVFGKIYFDGHVLASSGEAVWWPHSFGHLMHTFDCHIGWRHRNACLHLLCLSYLLFHHIIYQNNKIK